MKVERMRTDLGLHKKFKALLQYAVLFPLRWKCSLTLYQLWHLKYTFFLLNVLNVLLRKHHVVYEFHKGPSPREHELSYFMTIGSFRLRDISHVQLWCRSPSGKLSVIHIKKTKNVNPDFWGEIFSDFYKKCIGSKLLTAPCNGTKEKLQ